MNWNKNTTRIGAIVILAAIALRMLCSGLLGSALEVFAQPELSASLLLYAGTGRPVTPPEPADTTAATDATQPTQATEPSDATEPSGTTAPSESTEPSGTTAPSESTEPSVTQPPQTQPPETQPPETQPPTTEPPETRPPETEPPATNPPEGALVFTKADYDYVRLNSTCSYKPSINGMLEQTLKWDLTGDQPTILIYHSHATEAFTPTADTQYTETGGEFRTLDTNLNMVSIGDELARQLEQAGFTVIHDRTLHDNADYLDAYKNSRKSIQDYLDEYPSIQLVLDLHRDAAEYADGTQWATQATVNGQDSAQLMVVVGTDANGSNHPGWKKNLATGLKLSAVMEKIAPGVTRSVNLRSKPYNQDLSVGSLLIEVGSAGNTHQEAMNCISVLTEAIVELAHGANY